MGLIEVVQYGIGMMKKFQLEDSLVHSQNQAISNQLFSKQENQQDVEVYHLEFSHLHAMLNSQHDQDSITNEETEESAGCTTTIWQEHHP